MKRKIMVRTNLFLTQDEHEKVKKEAEERGITFSEMFRKIIDNYLENKKGEKIK
jgi:hypothetical protein